VQDPAAVAQQPVGDHLQPVAEAQAAQAEHAAVEDEQPAVAEHPHLAPELVLEVGRRLLGGDGVGHVDRPPAPLDHQVGERQVVAEARVDLDVVAQAHGVDRAVAAGHRAGGRLAGP
jgi:hypothetical protein